MNPSEGVPGGYSPLGLAGITSKCAWSRSDAKHHRRPGIPFETCIQDRKWLRNLERRETCGTRNAGRWIGGIDSLGEKEPWVRPGECHWRFHNGCYSKDLDNSLAQLETEQVEACQAGEVWREDLAMMLFTFPKCGGPKNRCPHPKQCRDEHWCSKEPLLRLFLRRLRSASKKLKWRGAPLSGRYVSVTEPHRSLEPHLHVVTRMLPPETELRDAPNRKWWNPETKLTEWKENIDPKTGKKYRREYATKEYIDVAKAIWYDLTGAHHVTWEIIASCVYYVAKYVGKWDNLGWEVKAGLTVNRLKLFSRSKGLIDGPKKDTRWIIECGRTEEEVRAKVGMPLLLQVHAHQGIRPDEIGRQAEPAGDDLFRDPSMGQDRR